MGSFGAISSFGHSPMSRPPRIQKIAPHPMLQAIMTARVKAGMTIPELGEISGVPYRTIQKMIYRGIGHYANIEALANALGYELTLTKRPSGQKESK